MRRPCREFMIKGCTPASRSVEMNGDCEFLELCARVGRGFAKDEWRPRAF